VVSISFQITPDEYREAMQAKMCLPGWYRNVLLLVPFLWLVSFVAWIFYPHATGMLKVFLVFTAIVLFVLLDNRLALWLRTKQAARTKLRYTYSYTFSEQGFVQKVEGREGPRSWRDVEKWEHARGFYYLNIRDNRGKRGAACIPARAFTDKQEAEFRQYLTAVK
jgi:YcxB-like protein